MTRTITYWGSERVVSGFTKAGYPQHLRIALSIVRPAAALVLLLPGLALLLQPLVHHPRALGLELTIYDPGLDTDLASGERLASLLERLIRP